jgi:hypothetical protein
MEQAAQQEPQMFRQNAAQLAGQARCPRVRMGFAALVPMMRVMLAQQELQAFLPTAAQSTRRIHSS